jgi:hypothetical protein
MVLKIIKISYSLTCLGLKPSYSQDGPDWPDLSFLSAQPSAAHHLPQPSCAPNLDTYLNPDLG